MVKDLTEGKPFLLLLKFSVPLILGNLFQQLYNLVDAMIVGRALGINALSAVGASTSVNFLIIGFCTGICTGFAIPVAQQFGAKDYHTMRLYVVNTYYLSAAVSLVMTLATCFLCGNILNWMKTPSLIWSDAYTYQFIIFLGIPSTIMYNILSSIIRALGDSKTPFYFLVIATISNVFLDLFCVLVLNLGVAGAGIATVGSQLFSGIACLIFIKRKIGILHVKRDEMAIGLPYCLKLLSLGIPMGLQTSITAIGSIMLQTAVNSLGTLEVAGYAAALKIKGIFICPYDGIGNAAATYCGQNLGAKKYDRLRQGVRSGVFMGLIWSAAAFIILQLFCDNISMLFVDKSEKDVLSLVRLFMHTTSCFYPVLPFLNTYRYAVQGLGYSKLALTSGLLEMTARTCMSLFVIPVFGFTAVTFTDQTAWISATIFSVTAFYLILHKITAAPRSGQSSSPE